MDIYHHPVCNHTIGPPKGVSSEDCSSLPVLVEQCGLGHTYLSFWKPSPEELATLNADGSVGVRLYGTQVMMQVAAVEKPEGP